MHSIMEFLLHHGYAALFAAVLAEQLGFPLPSTPFLIAAGALAGFGQLGLLRSLGVAILASVMSDLVWFYFGRREGALFVRLLSWLRLKPETGASEQRHGSARSILFAKFLPGLNLITSPLAGVMGLAPWKFLVLDSTAALLWAGAYMSIGWVFRGQLENVGAILERFGVLLGALAVLTLAVYVAVKLWQRRRSVSLTIRSKEALAH